MRSRAELARQSNRGVFAVAFSAGRDSTALLRVCAEAARTLGLNVVALHVHHGLLPQADAWLQRAQSTCKRWAASGLPVRLEWTRLAGRPARGDSIEAWARNARYAALETMAVRAGAHLILLAHHRQDQAETVLLQALRGAGAAGLAAMARVSHRNAIVWARPWIDQPRTAIEAYLRHKRLRYVDDPSNADMRFARNRLRAQVWPAMVGAFADAEVALNRVAQRAAESDAVLREVAACDLAPAVVDGRLQLAPWLRLSPARRANALRHWLGQTSGRGAPQALLQRLLAELPTRRQGRWPADGEHECALYRGNLSWRAVRRGASPPDSSIALDLATPGLHRVAGWNGAFEVKPVSRNGIAVDALRGAEVRPRTGGEQFQVAARGVARRLKKQYQAHAVAPHDRCAPLLFARGQLLYVPGLGIDARALAVAGQPQARVRWIPDTSTT